MERRIYQQLHPHPPTHTHSEKHSYIIPSAVKHTEIDASSACVSVSGFSV